MGEGERGGGLGLSTHRNALMLAPILIALAVLYVSGVYVSLFHPDMFSGTWLRYLFPWS